MNHVSYQTNVPEDSMNSSLLNDKDYMEEQKMHYQLDVLALLAI